MRRSRSRAQQDGQKRAGRTAQPRSQSASLVDAWWASVLAGDVYDPHPVHRDVKVRLHGGRLRLSGELETKEDRDELVQQARTRVGHGIDHVDASNLRVANRTEKPGILEQTLISAFPGREAAAYARDFVVQHSRVVPMHSDIVDAGSGQKLDALVTEDFAHDAGKALDSGHALLVMRVDEADAFKVRELLDEDTRSEWTIAMPPRLLGSSR